MSSAGRTKEMGKGRGAYIEGIDHEGRMRRLIGESFEFKLVDHAGSFVMLELDGKLKGVVEVGWRGVLEAGFEVVLEDHIHE